MIGYFGSDYYASQWFGSQYYRGSGVPVVLIPEPGNIWKLRGRTGVWEAEERAGEWKLAERQAIWITRP